MVWGEEQIVIDLYFIFHILVSNNPVKTVAIVPISVYQVQAIEVKIMMYIITAIPVMKAGMACLIRGFLKRTPRMKVPNNPT